jgi:hypothetical protein
VYVSDIYDDYVVVVKKGTGMITLAAGNGKRGYGGDGGQAELAALHTPVGLG